jgi:hypothetical protein
MNVGAYFERHARRGLLRVADIQQWKPQTFVKLSDSVEHRNPKTKSNPNTMCPPIAPGEDLGSGHFYLAKKKTFLLCVDSVREIPVSIELPRAASYLFLSLSPSNPACRVNRHKMNSG